MDDNFPPLSEKQKGFLEDLRSRKRPPAVILRHARGILATARQGAAQSAPRAVSIPPEVMSAATSGARRAPDAVRDALLSVSQEQQAGIHIAVVFGVATTAAVQTLRHKVENFDAWWAPRSVQMQNDELARYFYLLRSIILKEGYLDALRVNFTAHGTDSGSGVGVIETRLHQVPVSRLGASLPSMPVVDLLTIWLDMIAGFVEEAAQEWAPDGEDPMGSFFEEFVSSGRDEFADGGGPESAP